MTIITDKNFTILKQVSRFEPSKDILQVNDNLGKLIGIYNNHPFGDDLYIYQQGIYWNVNGVNYCFFYNELKKITLSDETDYLISIILDSGEQLNLPVRRQNEQHTDICTLLYFLNNIMDTHRVSENNK